jgi:hypothetical protein
MPCVHDSKNCSDQCDREGHGLNQSDVAHMAANSWVRSNDWLGDTCAAGDVSVLNAISIVLSIQSWMAAVSKRLLLL